MKVGCDFRFLKLFFYIFITLIYFHTFGKEFAHYHIVQPGETIDNIAEMYGFSPQELLQKNHLKIGEYLNQGQKLILPTNIKPAKSAVKIAMKSPIPKKIVKKPDINGSPYAYYGNGEPVANALKSFASNYGLPIIVSNTITSVVNGTIGPLPPIDFLDTLSQLNNLLWYFDGDTLYVYSGEEIVKKIINLKAMPTHKLKKTLIDIGLWDSRYGWKERSQEGIIYLSGPPRYVELVTETATILDNKAAQKQKSELTFKVFPLKYAWAEDHTINYRNNQVTIPGIATLLRQIVFNKESTNQPETSEYTKGITPSTPITGNQKTNEKNPPAKQEVALSTASADNVLINADRRSNSIIIHDLSSKMSMYAGLIKSLDKPLSQVEINVSIIDVDTNSFDELGINWKFNSNHNHTQISFDPSSSLTNSPASTILKITAKKLLGQIKMLATKNKAKILSQPSVLTLDNMEAVLDNSSTFYVPVNGSNAGDNTAQLYPITSGSILKVTPRIINEKNDKKIHLDVNIQDGTSQDSSLSGVSLPIVKNTTISTQAMIKENESLLVGGYFYEKTSDAVKKIPLLGDIPIIGALFREKSKIHSKNVRLFLITPKIMNLL